jgi:hypothetical protein
MVRVMPAIDPALPYTAGRVAEHGVEWVWTCRQCDSYQRVRPPSQITDPDPQEWRAKAHHALEAAAMAHSFEFHGGKA